MGFFSGGFDVWMDQALRIRTWANGGRMWAHCWLAYTTCTHMNLKWIRQFCAIITTHQHNGNNRNDGYGMAMLKITA